MMTPEITLFSENKMLPLIHLLASPLASEKYDEPSFLSLLVHDTRGKCQFYPDFGNTRLLTRRLTPDPYFRWQRYYPSVWPLPPLKEAPDVLIPVKDSDQLVVRETDHCGEGDGRTLTLEDVAGARGGHQDSDVTTAPELLSVTSQAGDRDVGEVTVRRPVQMPLSYPSCLHSGKIAKSKMNQTMNQVSHF